MQMGRKIHKEVLTEILRRIVDVARPEKIILFGSTARGDRGPDSDLDLLVIKSGDYNPRTVAADDLHETVRGRSGSRPDRCDTGTGAEVCQLPVPGPAPRIA